MKIVVGLGNPGKTYAKTRHNIGFRILDAFHERQKMQGVSPWHLSKKFNAEIAEGMWNNEKMLLVKPMTFMNRSGEAVSLIIQYYHSSLDDLLVVHDDKDLPLGTIKLQRNRSDAGHNGVKSLIEHVGTQDFTRARVGVTSDQRNKEQDTATFVLAKFGLLEKRKVHEIVEAACTEITRFLSDQIQS